MVAGEERGEGRKGGRGRGGAWCAQAVRGLDGGWACMSEGKVGNLCCVLFVPLSQVTAAERERCA